MATCDVTKVGTTPQVIPARVGLSLARKQYVSRLNFRHLAAKKLAVFVVVTLDIRLRDVYFSTSQFVVQKRGYKEVASRAF